MKRKMRKLPKVAPKVAAPAASKAPASNVSPQDQAMYDRVVLAARRNLYGDQGDDTRFKMVLQRLAGAKGELGIAIGKITAVIITNIQGSIQKAGKQVPGYVLFHAGREIIADLVQIAVSAKFMDQGQVAQVTKDAMMEAVRAYKMGQAAPPQPPQSAPAAQPAPPAQAAPPMAAAPPMPPARPGIINAVRGA